FHTPSLRVEQWSIAQQKMTQAHEISTSLNCAGGTELSPDGHLLACVFLDNGFGVRLLDVSSGETKFEKKNIQMLSWMDALTISIAQLFGNHIHPLVNFGFSPDAHYFVAAGREVTLAVELPNLNPVPQRS